MKSHHRLLSLNNRQNELSGLNRPLFFRSRHALLDITAVSLDKPRIKWEKSRKTGR